jgi:iron(III) transport system substrate-binding protein
MGTFMYRKAARLAGAVIAATIASAPAATEVNIYTNRDPEVIEPLLRAYQAAMGMRVKVTYAREGLIERIVAEGERSPPDVVLTYDLAPLLEARRRDLTEPFKPRGIEADVPAVYRDPEGHWFGLTRRPRVFVVSANRVDTSAMTYEQLADPRWKGRICLRSGGHPYNVGLIAAMLAHHGPNWTETWLRGMKTNLARKPSGRDRDQIRAVMEGVCDLAVVNSHYVAAFLFLDQDLRAQKHELRILVPSAADRGTHIAISGAALMKHSRNKEDSIKLIEFLTSELGQRIQSVINDEYPISDAVPPPSLFASLGPLHPDSLPLHKIVELRRDALTLVERTKFDQGPD